MRLLVLFASIALYACTREDGQPVPPPQPLVACDHDAGADDPLACPAAGDSAAAADGGPPIDGDSAD